jgi:hypothetical protein
MALRPLAIMTTPATSVSSMNVGRNSDLQGAGERIEVDGRGPVAEKSDRHNNGRNKPGPGRNLRALKQQIHEGNLAESSSPSS